MKWTILHFWVCSTPLNSCWTSLNSCWTFHELHGVQRSSTEFNRSSTVVQQSSTEFVCVRRSSLEFDGVHQNSTDFKRGSTEFNKLENENPLNSVELHWTPLNYIEFELCWTLGFVELPINPILVQRSSAELISGV